MIFDFDPMQLIGFDTEMNELVFSILIHKSKPFSFR